MSLWNYAVSESLLSTGYSQQAQWARTQDHFKRPEAEDIIRATGHKATTERVTATVLMMNFVKWGENFQQHVQQEYKSGLGELMCKRYAHGDTAHASNTTKDQDPGVQVTNDSANKAFKILSHAGYQYLLNSFIPRMLRYAHQEATVLNLPELLAIIERWDEDGSNIMYAIVMEFTSLQRKDLIA